MKPLEGIKVVELATMLAGPMTGRLLAEWGADVIKVESMNGDAWRKQGGTTLSPLTEVANPNFDMQNLNKRFVALNLRTPEGMGAMRKLLENADVLVTNYREQALEGMGLSYSRLKDEFPRLIVAHVLGYGSDGPEKDRPGYDYTAFAARTGFMADLAPAGGPPMNPIAGVGDHSVAISLAGGIAAALYRRSVTGQGDKVDVSLLQCGLFIVSTGILNAFNGRKLPRTRFDCGHAGSCTYQGSDGEWFYLAVVDYRRFAEFCSVIGHPEIAEDPRFSTNDAYYQNRSELVVILDRILSEKPVSYWDKLLNEHDLPHEVLHHFKDAPSDPQVAANRYVEHITYSDGTKTVTVNGPVHFGSVDWKELPKKTSGKLGCDTAEVLAELGYSADEIRSMFEKGEVK